MAQPAPDAAHLTRNAEAALPDGALARRMGEVAAAGRPLRAKLGLDPTAPDLHLGHTVVLQKLREFQDLGHKVVLIVGDYTARVGDPSGRSVERPVLSGEQIDRNARTYQAQAFKVLRDDPELLEVRHNSEWLDMRMEDLFRLARTTTVAQLLERRDFAERFAAQTPISVLELLYPLMQGYDSVAVEADVELGGTDQTFNLMLGRDVQRAYGAAQQSVLTMPLLVGTDGQQKMSKSVGNHIGITEPPGEMYGKTLSLPDEAMAGWFSLLGIAPAPAGSSPRDEKHWLARQLVTRFWSCEDAEAAARTFEQVVVQGGIPDDIEVFLLREEEVHLPALIAEAFGRSRSEGRRLLAAGAVKLDGTEWERATLDAPADALDGRVMQVGKRAFRRLQRI